MDQVNCPSGTVCFTGHRIISPDRMDEVKRFTLLAVEEAYDAGYRTYICGGARGYDTVAAKAVLFFRRNHPDVRLVIAVPCASQAEHWPEKEKDDYRMILNRADSVIILSEAYYNGCMQSRNRYMVDHSALCICYMTQFKGGTWSTVRYALHQGIGVKNIAIHCTGKSILKENSWNYTSTYRSASGNVSIVHLCHFRKSLQKKTNILICFSVKAGKEKKNSPNR